MSSKTHKIIVRLLFVCAFIIWIYEPTFAECDLELDPFCEDIDLPLDQNALKSVIIAIIFISFYFKWA